MKQKLEISQRDPESVSWLHENKHGSSNFYCPRNGPRNIITIGQTSGSGANPNLQVSTQSAKLKPSSFGVFREAGRQSSSALSHLEPGRMSPLHIPKCRLSPIPSSPPIVNVIYIENNEKRQLQDRSYSNKDGGTSLVHFDLDFLQKSGSSPKLPCRPPLPPPAQMSHHTTVENEPGTLIRSGRKVQRSLALTSFRKNKNTYVALPTTEALQQNVLVSPKSKKILQLPLLKHSKKSIDAHGNKYFSLLPLSQRTRSHDELNIHKGFVNNKTHEEINNNRKYNTTLMPSKSYDNIHYSKKLTLASSQDDLCYRSEEDLINMKSEPHSPNINQDLSPKLRNAALYQNGIRRNFSYFPKEKDPYATEEESKHARFETSTQDKVKLRRPPECTNVLPRAKLRRRSIAVAQEFLKGGLSRHGVPTRRSVREDSRQKRNQDGDNNDVSRTSTINSGAHSSQEGGQQKQQHLQEQITKQTGNNYTPTKIANLLSRKLTKITKSPKLEKEKNKITNNDVEKSTEGSSASSSSHNTPVGTPHDTPTATPPNHRHLRQRVQIKINRDDSRRTENILKIWILEVKGVPPKKKYYCNIVVDGQLCHSTVAKQKTNMCFWGQDFHISLDSQDSIVHVELMRGIDKGRTKLVGRITIPLKTTSKGEALLTGLVEQWYPITCDKQEKDAPQLRIKHKFQSLTVLPLVNYARLREYLSKQSTSLCQVLEHNLSVKAKEDLAHALVHITHAEGCINNFLVTLIINDIDRIESEQCLFRGNSVATKAIEAYMRLVGEQYLQETLSSVVQKIISATEDMEVDPMRITNLANLPVIIKQQQSTLRLCVEEVWEHILQSADNFPVELRKVFHTLRQRLIHHKEKLEHTDNLISACVFLRFICPAILSPSLFDIVQEYPEERAGRHLTLVAKTIQTLANFTWFHRKENYMEFLNDFIAQEQTNCRNFLRKVSSYDTNVGSHLEFVGDIDLGLNLALLHVHLAEAMPNLLIKDNAMDTRKMALLVREISSQINPSSVPLMENIYNSTIDASHRYTLNKDLTDNNQKQTDNDSTVQTVVGSESKSVDSKSVDSKGVDSNSLQNSCIQQQIDEYTQAAQEITLLASNMEQGQNNICNNRYI